MKTLKLLILFLFSGIFLNAQITINYGDLVTIGDTIIQGEDDNITSYSVGGTGSQTWDFSGMTADSQDTLIFINPADAPFGSSFPDAEMAVEILQDNNGNPDTMFMYIDNESDYLHILGMSANPYNDVHSYPYQNIMPYPVTYGDEFFSEYTSIAKFYNGTDSMMYKLYANDTINVDAFGYVSLPSGTYNSLRFYHNVIKKDSVFMKTGTEWNLINSQEYPQDYYEWWTNDPSVEMKVAELQTDEQGVVTGGNFMKEAFLHSTSVSELSDISNFMISYSGNGNILLRNIPKSYNKVFIYDISGKEIQSKMINSDITELNVQHLSPGIYIVTLSSPSGSFGNKIFIK